MTIDLHEAISQAAEGARQLGNIAQSARRHVVELTVELEDARQEIGRLRARDEAQEAGATDAEQLAIAFHEAYERLAPRHGYETREASAKPWADVPANNRALMCAVAAELIVRFDIHAPHGVGLSPLPVEQEASP